MVKNSTQLKTVFDTTSSTPKKLRNFFNSSNLDVPTVAV